VSRLPLRRLTALALVLVPVIAGCGQEATLSEHSVENGAQASSSTMIVHDAYLVATTGTASTLYVSLFNNSGGADTLESVAPAGGSPARFTVALPSAGIRVAAGGVLDLESASTALKVSGISSELPIGTEVPVTFSFATAGALRVTVPVESVGGDAAPADSPSAVPS
jgi:copper(I)-binding protein